MKNLVWVFLMIILGVQVFYAQIIEGLDVVGATTEELTAVKKDSKWGFIDNQGNLVINYRDDLVVDEEVNSPVFIGGLTMIEVFKEGIPYYGFIDKKGKKVIPAKFLDVKNFKNGFSIALLTSQKSRGKSMLGKEIIDNYYEEVIINKKGEIVKYLYGPKIVTLTKGYYKKPEIVSKILSDQTVASKNNDGTWAIFNYK